MQCLVSNYNYNYNYNFMIHNISDIDVDNLFYIHKNHDNNDDEIFILFYPKCTKKIIISKYGVINIIDVTDEYKDIFFITIVNKRRTAVRRKFMGSRMKNIMIYNILRNKKDVCDETMKIVQDDKYIFIYRSGKVAIYYKFKDREGELIIKPILVSQNKNLFHRLYDNIVRLEYMNKNNMLNRPIFDIPKYSIITS